MLGRWQSNWDTNFMLMLTCKLVIWMLMGGCASEVQGGALTIFRICTIASLHKWQFLVKFMAKAPRIAWTKSRLLETVHGEINPSCWSSWAGRAARHRPSCHAPAQHKGDNDQQLIQELKYTTEGQKHGGGTSTHNPHYGWSRLTTTLRLITVDQPSECATTARCSRGAPQATPTR